MTRKLVALGSSFAAGSGIAPIIHRKAMRSGRNYPHLLATRLKAELLDLTVGGATLLNVLEVPQRYISLPSSTAPPQLSELPSDADIVTLTAGGNDLFYSGSMTLDAIKTSLSSFPIIGTLLSPFLSADSSTLPITVDELTSRFVSIIDKISEVAPHATIVLVDYLTIFSEASRTGPGNPLSTAQMQKHRKVADCLQQGYRNAAARRPGVLLLLASDLSEHNGVCTFEPWVTGFSIIGMIRGDAPYHPNALGHENIANRLYDMLAVESRRL